MGDHSRCTWTFQEPRAIVRGVAFHGTGMKPGDGEWGGGSPFRSSSSWTRVADVLAPSPRDTPGIPVAFCCTIQIE